MLIKFSELSNLLLQNGFKPGATEKPLCEVDPKELPAYATNTRGKHYFQVGSFRILVAEGANLMQLKGEIFTLEGRNPKNATPENPNGEWKMALIR